MIEILGERVDFVMKASIVVVGEAKSGVSNVELRLLENEKLAKEANTELVEGLWDWAIAFAEENTPVDVAGSSTGEDGSTGTELARENGLEDTTLPGKSVTARLVSFEMTASVMEVAAEDNERLMTDCD